MPYEQTDILISRFLSGEASPEEAMQVEDWANESASNRNYLNDYSKILGLSFNSEGRKTVAWKKIKAAAVPGVFSLRGISIAASIFLVVGVGLVYFLNPKPIVYQAKASPRKVFLQDNTEIIVSPNSTVIIDKSYGKGNRKIKLEGSAYFSVIHDPVREFIIDMNSLHIRDVGTKFKILSSADSIFINVDEGEIAAYDDFGASKNAVAGEKLVYVISQKKLHVVEPTAEKIVAIKDSGLMKKMPVAQADSPVQHSYPSEYPVQKGYTQEGKEALKRKDSILTEKLIVDLLKGRLISRRRPLSFKLNNSGFTVNGVLQSAAIFRRYTKKYTPFLNTTGDWEWSHSFPNP